MISISNTSLKNGYGKNEIVMQSTSYNCGPAALATVINLMGIKCSEKELAEIAGTDETGTTMYGLMMAAQKKGLVARGMRLGLEYLKPYDIVFINMGKSSHYSVIFRVNSNSVCLADPSLGEIEMKRKEFAKIYTGNALVILSEKEEDYNFID